MVQEGSGTGAMYEYAFCKQNDRQKAMTENITFPQLRWWMVIM